MSEPNRTRRLNCRVTEDEYALIERKMKQLGTENISAYLRKMALDGFPQANHVNMCAGPRARFGLPSPSSRITCTTSGCTRSPG